MKYQQGVYVTPDPSYCADAPESHIHEMARAGQVHLFVYRRVDGPTGFGSEAGETRVLVELLMKSFIFDDYRQVLRDGFEFGDDNRILNAAFRNGLAIFEPDAILREQNERLPEFRRQLKIFQVKYRHGHATIAPEPPAIARLGIGKCTPALLDYLQAHCGLLLECTACEGGYIRSINGSRDAKAYLLTAFASAQVPVFEVPSERDLPVW